MWWIWAIGIIIVLAVGIPLAVFFLRCKITPNQITSIDYRRGDSTSPNGYAIVTVDPVNCVVTSLSGQQLNFNLFFGSTLLMQTHTIMTGASDYTFPLPTTLHPGFTYQAQAVLNYRDVSSALAVPIQIPTSLLT